MANPMVLAGAGFCVYLVLTAAAGRVVRSRVTDARQSSQYVPVSRVGAGASGEFVDFPAKSFAAHPGPMALVTPRGSRLILGPPQLHSGIIRRAVVEGETTSLRLERRGRLSGHLGETPGAHGLQYQSVTNAGQQMWEVAGRSLNREAVWVIHVHGLGSHRSQTLRGVRTFAELGFTSLVPTYRTSLDGHSTPPRSHLGLTEWQQVTRAQDYALAAGAEKIIYVGWSLGASIVLQAIERSPRPEVCGALLVSPALDWRAITLAGLKAARVPAWIASWAVSGFNLVRGIGSPRISWGRLPGTSRATDPQVPLLVFHGTDDRSVPIQLSRALAGRRSGQRHRMVEFPGAHHTLEWNSNPSLWSREVHSWCETLGLWVGTPADTFTNDLEIA